MNSGSVDDQYGGNGTASEGAEPNKIASAMADRHPADPAAFRRADPPTHTGKGKEIEAGDGEGGKRPGRFGEKWKSGLVVSGIVVALVGAVLVFATKMKGKPKRD